MGIGATVVGTERHGPAAAPSHDAEDPANAELQALLLASGRGDRAAFEALYRRTSARLYAVIGRSVWNRGEADEVLQELYVKVWHHAADYDPARSRPMAWLGRIARNIAIDHLRRASQRARHERNDVVSADEGQGMTERHADAGPGPLDQLELQRVGEQARALLVGLSPSQQQVIVLGFWHGLSQTEIAECLGLPLGTVKSLVRRGLMAMRESIERQEARQARWPAGRPAHAVAAGGPAGIGWFGLRATAWG
jgi:RNA polymerase sigma factor (sigma-70 family)